MTVSLFPLSPSLTSRCQSEDRCAAAALGLMLKLSWVSSLRRRRAPTRKLRGAGFDEDTVMRRDKAELIGRIARLESEICDHQQSLGLILLERKELTSKLFEQLKASSEATEIMLKQQPASQESSLAETRKRKNNLKRNLAIQKERVSNLEKALHDMCGETAEVKVSYEAKLAKTLQMIEAAQKKFAEAEEKLLAAKSLEAECIRIHNASLKSQLENASKEKDINLLRKSLDEKEQSLLKEQVLLNQRDENILEKVGYVTQSEKRLKEEKLNLEDDRKVLLEEKNKLYLNMQAIIYREKAIIQKESILDKRESELLVLQKTISKERAEIERLRQEQEVALVGRKQEFDTEMDIKLASFEQEIDARKTLLDQRETVINEKEDAVAQREQNLNLRLAELTNKEKSLVKKSDELRKEEKRLSCGKLKSGGMENLKENDVHMSPAEDKNAGSKHSIVNKLELSPVSTPIFWVRKCARVIFKRSLEKSVDPHNDGLVPAKLANVNDSSLASAYSDGHQLENGAGNVPQTEDGLKVGKKRPNNVLSHGGSEILQPKRKQQRGTKTFGVIGGEIDSNCGPSSALEEKCSKNEHDAVPVGSSALEEKCSKNEHDAVPVGLCGKGPHNPQGKLASSAESDEHSEDISVSAAEPSNGHHMVDSEDKDEPDEDSDDEGDKEEKMSSAKKIWHFLIT